MTYKIDEKTPDHVHVSHTWYSYHIYKKIPTNQQINK